MLSADAKSLRKMGTALRKSRPVMYRELQKALRAEGEAIRRRAAETASAWSKQIPDSGKVRADGVNAMKVLFASRNAQPVENHGKGHVRHPVFGDRNVWTAKNSHPAFLLPAATARLPESSRAVGEALQGQVEKIIHGQEMSV